MDSLSSPHVPERGLSCFWITLCYNQVHCKRYCRTYLTGHVTLGTSLHPSLGPYEKSFTMKARSSRKRIRYLRIRNILPFKTNTFTYMFSQHSPNIRALSGLKGLVLGHTKKTQTEILRSGRQDLLYFNIFMIIRERYKMYIPHVFS